MSKQHGSEMRVGDRILCALGMHGSLVDAGMRITQTDFNKLTGPERIVGGMLRCTRCGRLKRWYVA